MALQPTTRSGSRTFFATKNPVSFLFLLSPFYFNITFPRPESMISHLGKLGPEDPHTRSGLHRCIQVQRSSGKPIVPAILVTRPSIRSTLETIHQSGTRAQKGGGTHATKNMQSTPNAIAPNCMLFVSKGHPSLIHISALPHVVLVCHSCCLPEV